MLKKLIFVILLGFSSASYAAYPNQEETLCLAQTLYHEARGENRSGILAVANLTINRTKSRQFPNSICGVVRQRNLNGCQYSWVCSGAQVKNNKKFAEMWQISDQILRGKIRMNILSHDVMWFHNKHVKPWWAKHGTFAGRIGSHLYYKNVKK